MATITLHYDGRSSLMKHLIETMLAAGAKLQPSAEVSEMHDADKDFYNDKETLRSFQQSVEQENQGLVREVSLDEVKQMLRL